MKNSLRSGLALITAAGLVWTACEQGPVTAPDGSEATDGPAIAASTSPIPNGVIGAEEYEVCKFGPTATFDYTVTAVDPRLSDDSGQFTLNDGECYVIGIWGGLGVTVDVLERVDLFTGNEQLDRIDLTTADYSADMNNPTIVTTTITGTNVVPQQAVFGNDGGGPNGVLVEFYNSRPTGGEGCTPGYWKQPHHFDSWVGALPDDLFTSLGLEDAYPGMTLLQVLQNKGNKTGLEALGRHTVAAWLNSQAVNYAYTGADVVNMFNAVYPGSKGEYNALKDQFSTENESGCPLN
jgi:hypothetical protein